MKKLLYLLPFFLLTGCSPQFTEGGWIIPSLTAAGALYCWYRYFDTGYRVPFIIGIILTLATGLITLIMALDL